MLSLEECVVHESMRIIVNNTDESSCSVIHEHFLLHAGPEGQTAVLNISATCTSPEGSIFIHPFLYDIIGEEGAVEHCRSVGTRNAVKVRKIPWDLSDASAPPKLGCWWEPLRMNLNGAKVSRVHLHLTRATGKGFVKLSCTSQKRCVALALMGRKLLVPSTHIFLELGNNEIICCQVLSLFDLEGNLLSEIAGYEFELDTLEIELSFQTDGLNVSEDKTALVGGTSPLDCGGYDETYEILCSLLNPGVASPTGILLTGPKGVGKSFLASVLAYSFGTKGWAIHTVSVNDVMMQANFSTHENIERMMIPDLGQKTLVIIDDIDVVSVDDDASFIDPEKKLVRTSLVRVIDVLVSRKIPVLAIARECSVVQEELLKANRLEKEITMETPTQLQRQEILKPILLSFGLHNDDRFQSFIELLSEITPGYVAGDLLRLCISAWTFSRRKDSSDRDPIVEFDDFLRALRETTPSQLESLDVIQPRFHAEVKTAHWRQNFDLAWTNFAGYSKMKKLVYRSIVLPWRIHVSGGNCVGIAPPRGVLFHGPSGCGKTHAVENLANALSLPIIKVRTVDVLDKWVGGSERAIRDLFARARASSPVILFFDEIDAIATNRQTDGDSTNVISRILSTLLNEMDGISSDSTNNVLVVACTNRLEAIDAALLRPGRLEEHILLDLPTLEDIKKLLQQKFSNVKVSGCDINQMAKRMNDAALSCALINGIAREAILRLIEKGPDSEGVENNIDLTLRGEALDDILAATDC